MKAWKNQNLMYCLKVKANQSGCSTCSNKSERLSAYNYKFLKENDDSDENKDDVDECENLLEESK